MTITQMVQNRQQQRIGELTQKQQGKPHVNPYGTPGMSLNDAGDFRKMVPVAMVWCSRSSRSPLTT